MTDLKYSIAVDANQADAELARLHQSATTLAGSEDKLAASTTAATAALTKQGDAAGASAGKHETLRQRIGKMPDVLGKQAAAISLVSSSMEGQNGEVGKLVAGAGQLAAAFGAGGPYGLALVATMGLVAKLTEYWEAQNAAEEAAIALKYAAIDAASAEKNRLQTDLVALRRTADPEAAVKADRESAVAKIESLRAQTAGLRIAAMQYGVSKEDATTMNAKVGLQKDQLALLEEELTLRDKIAAKAAKPVGAGDAPKKPKAARSAKGDSLRDSDAAARMQENADLAQNLIDEASRAQAAINEIENEAIAKRDKRDQLAEDKAEDAADAAIKRAKRIADNNEAFAVQNGEQRKAANAALLAAEQGFADAAIGIFASSTTQLMTDVIGGQEKALERMGANILSQAGTFVVGEGIKVASLGAGRLLGGDPTGAIPLAGGLALVGLGASMGGAGAAWATQLGGGGAGGGDRGPSSRGVPSGPATVGNGSTSNNVTIVYAGASGPTADHGARAVTDANERARDRLLRRPEVR